MKKELFDNLLQSVREGGAIMRGEIAPSRVFDAKLLDVKTICEKLDQHGHGHHRTHTYEGENHADSNTK